MPIKARIGSINGKIVYANEVQLKDIHQKFYCATPGCSAEMTLVQGGDIQNAYFRRVKSSPPHTSIYCTRCSIRFEVSQYDEKKFNIDTAFNYILGQGSSFQRGDTGNKTGRKGGGKPGIRTLGNLYYLCINKSKNDYYNGILIDDILADKENYSRYCNNLKGNLLVECSFYKKVMNEPILLFNYPSDFKKTHNIVEVHFADQQMCWDYYWKCRECSHIEPIVIAGNWETIFHKGKYVSKCQINSSRQFMIVKGE